MTHTPGPWSVDDFDKMQVIAGDRRVCRTENVDNPFEACEANARLIAAAPDLLDAFRPFAKLAELITAEAPQDSDYVSLWLDCEGISHRLTMDELRAASDAFSKATHKPQEG